MQFQNEPLLTYDNREREQAPRSRQKVCYIDAMFLLWACGFPVEEVHRSNVVLLRNFPGSVSYTHLTLPTKA